MTDRYTATRFAELDLPHWRWILGSIEAAFRSGVSFVHAADLAAAVARLAEEVGHTAAVDVRPPATIRVVVAAGPAGGVGPLEVELARRISAAADEAGMTADPRRIQGLEVAVDALDIPAVVPFWRAALGYELAEPIGSLPALIDPMGDGPAVWFQQMDEPRVQRNRIHLDISLPHDEVADRLAATLAAGGTLVSDRRAPAFWVLADAEGNEACLCTWQGRD